MASQLNKPKQFALLTWLAGLLLSAVLAWWVHGSNQRLYEARLLALTDEATQLVERNFQLYEYGLRGARGAVVVAGSTGGTGITRDMFAAYMQTRDLAREFPGALGFGFIRRVPRTDETRFLAGARKDGAAEFNIRELAPHANDPFVIQYIYPTENNLAATGLDVASETNRREAALAAARNDEVRLTAPITLVQSGELPRRGFLALLPVYREGAPVHTPEARAAAALGWTYAPLVVDDVLAGMRPRFQEIGIRLTDTAEPKPFFDSAAIGIAQALAGVPELTRELPVFGRRWQLQSYALQPLASAARPLSAVLVAGTAAIVASMLALLVWAILQRRSEGNGGVLADEKAATATTLRRFLRSPLARWAGLIYVFSCTIYLVLDYQAQWAQQMSEARRTLSGLVDERAARLMTSQVSRRKSMLFLADVPPVQGLVRAAPTGIDPRDGSSRSSWELRMQQILGAYIRSSPEVFQARYIGVANNGRELVRVNKRGDDVVVTPEADLQAKGDRPYMQQTLPLRPGEMWVSNMELNQENGKVEQPHRPTIRYSTPVYKPDGKPFGIVIINIEVAEQLTDSVAKEPPGVTLFITNADGDFFRHPDPARRFGFELGQRYRWEDQFKAAALPHSVINDRLQAWLGPQGLVIAATAQVSPNANSSVGTIRYIASTPLSKLEAAVWQGLLRDIRLPLAVGAAFWLLLYYYWCTVQRQLQVRGERLKLASIVDLSMDAIVGLDAARLVTSWNRGAVQLFGIDERNAIGKPLLELIDAAADAGQLFDTDANVEIWQASEFECRGVEGGRICVAMTLSHLGGGTNGESSAILRDVTAERTAQQRIVEINRTLEQQVEERTASLTKERQRLDNILSSTRVGTWEWNVSTGVAVFNARWADIIGYQLEELMPISIETWAAYVHPEDLAKSGALLQSHFAGTLEHYSVEVRMRHKSGRWVWVLSRGQLVTRTHDGAPEWMYGTHQEITAIKEAELEVKRVATLLSSVLSAATELSIIATDAQGLITLFNAGAEHMLGYSAGEMVGVSSPASLHLQSEVAARAIELSEQFGVEVAGFRVFVHIAEISGSERREWSYVRKDGSTLRVSLVVTTIRDDGGGIAGYLGIAQDITERLRAESALRHAKAAAEIANTAKSMFLANMSHEIRTPMNAVIGIAHLLESTPLDDDQRNLLRKLQISGRSLLGIINDVLDLSKIEAGEMGVEAAPMSPLELLRELEQMFSPQTQAKGIAFELRGLDALPQQLITDELRLRQILINLTSNAIKFTSQGRVSIEVQREFDAQQQPWLRWRVCDTGVGIRPEALIKLFDPFVQADATTTRRFGGTGLGLSIVRKLAGLMGGEVGVQSELGHGSEFWLRLPLIEASENLPAALEGSGGLISVVVVDDNPDDRSILAGMCRSLGWGALELASGEELEAHYQRILDADLISPDALLVDWQMPGLDGLQALARVADMVGRNRLPATLIISAHERSAIAALNKNLLVDEILTKPVDASELFNAVNSSVSIHTGSTERVARSTRVGAIDGQWLVGVQVLVVDDSDINLEVARRLLERDGAIVATATNGLNAIELLRREPSRYDAVLMDVQMPEMDGYEATRLIRSELGLSTLPVLALTAGALGEERRRAEAAGMNDFLTKPLDPQLLVRAVRQAVETARGQPLQLIRDSKTAEPPAGWPEIAGIDSHDAARRIGHDAVLYLRMLERFISEYSSVPFASSERDDPSVDRDALTARLHKLRGSSGLLGMNDLHRISGELETALRAGADISTVNPSLVELDQALLRLENAARPVIVAHQHGDSRLTDCAAATSVLAEPELMQLVSLLRQQDFSAGERFHELAPSLTARWGSAHFAQVRQAVDELDFSKAVQLIEQAPNSAGG